MSPIPDRFLVIVSEEMPVHISALQVTAVVSDHYSIGIYNRQNPKLEFISHPVWNDVFRY